MQISEMQWKIKKESLVSEKMVFELVATNSAYCCQNTCHRLKISHQTEGDFLQLSLPRIVDRRG